MLKNAGEKVLQITVCISRHYVLLNTVSKLLLRGLKGIVMTIKNNEDRLNDYQHQKYCTPYSKKCCIIYELITIQENISLTSVEKTPQL